VEEGGRRVELEEGSRWGGRWVEMKENEMGKEHGVRESSASMTSFVIYTMGTHSSTLSITVS